MAVHSQLSDSELHDVKGVATAPTNSILQPVSGSGAWTSTPTVSSITATTFIKASAPTTLELCKVLTSGYDSETQMPVGDPTGTSIVDNSYEAVNTADTVLVCETLPTDINATPAATVELGVSFTDSTATSADTVILEVFGIKEKLDGTYQIVEDTPTLITVDLSTETINSFNTVETSTLDLTEAMTDNTVTYLVVRRKTTATEDNFPYSVFLSTPIFKYNRVTSI